MGPSHTSDRAALEALFLDNLPEIERIIAFACQRQFVADGDREDFGSHVKLRLIEDDYAILAKFQGRSRLKTYLVVVVQRLLLDFRASRWGKWRPSTEAKRCGPNAVLLEQLLLRDGYSYEEAFEIMTTNHHLSLSRSELDLILSRLPRRVRRRFESDEVLASIPSPNARPDRPLLASEGSEMARRVTSVVTKLLSELGSEDRLILLLKHSDGQTVTEIARMLSIEQRPLYRRIERLEAELANHAEAEGIEAAVVRELLSESSIDWSLHSVSGKSIDPEPSKATGGVE